MVVHESTMICVDNSGWMRNGDYPPTRLQCQQDAANLLLQYKIRLSPENTVGIISMADTVEVLASPCSESSKLFMRLYQVVPKGVSDVLGAIKVAHLALKHRLNRNHRMHIIVFIGSPLDQVDPTELTKIGKKLKKEKVVVDLICFGEADSNCNDVFGSFVESLSYKDAGASSLIIVSPGSTLSEALVSSSLVSAENGAAVSVIPSGGGGYEVDSEIDADLALALRVSLEEQRHNLNNQNQGVNATNDYNQTNTVDIMNMDPSLMTEEQQLEWALRMSMQETVQVPVTENTMQVETSTNLETIPGLVELPEANTVSPVVEEKGEASTEMEVDASDASSTAKTKNAGGGEELGELLSDPNLLRQLVDDISVGEVNLTQNQDNIEPSSTEKEKKGENEEKK